MSVDTSWDIESYRTAYESEEHWALKRDFLEAHKDRIPEARLICLAQVFVNVELLGCKYPDPVMEQVAVLARDVGHDYKENKKKKLQRTFVKASDAAEAKVKGTSTSTLLGASPYDKSSITEQHMSPYPPEPPTSMSSVGAGQHNPMSSILGQPPTSMASRRAAFVNPVSFVKAGASNPLSDEPSMSSTLSSMRAGASNTTSMPGWSAESRSSMYGGNSSGRPMLGGASMHGESSNASSMPGGLSSSNSSSLMYGGAPNTMSSESSMYGRGSNAASSGSSMTSMYGRGSNMMSGESSMYSGASDMASSGSSSMYGGGPNPKPSGSSMSSMYSGGLNAASTGSSMYGGGPNTTSRGSSTSSISSMSNQVSFVKGGVSNPLSNTPGSSTSNPVTSTYSGSSTGTSLLGGPPSSMPMLGSSSNANTTSLLGEPPSREAILSSMFGGPSHTLSMSTGPAAPKTTLITAPPTPKKKKSKADKDKDKPIAEKFVKFTGGDVDSGMTGSVKTANTVPLQKVGGRFGEASGQGQAQSRFPQSGQPSQSQPSQPQSATTGGMPQTNHLSNWCNVVGRNNPLAGFVVVRHENHDNNGAAAAILNTSSCFSRIPINYNYQKLDDHWFECTVNINGVDVVSAKAIGRKKAREYAVIEAVEELPKHCFTLKIKKSIRAESITLDQVASDLALRSSSSDPMATNSVANKMMKQMGWTGGGLGKKGEGITEPIRPSEVFGRRGLGHIETNKGAVTPAFRKRVRDIIQDFAANSENVALAFSNEFSKEQRVEIHKIARLSHLKSASRGKDGKDRCLVISRKVAAQDLLLRLLQEGSNDQYQLLPPTSSSC